MMSSQLDGEVNVGASGSACMEATSSAIVDPTVSKNQEWLIVHIKSLNNLISDAVCP